MTKTVLRGAWPGVEQPMPAAETNSGFKVVQVPYTYTPQATGVSVYQKEIEALFNGQPGQTAIECDTNAKAKRLVTAVQRQVNRLKRKDSLRVVTKQVDGGVTLVWLIKKDKK